MEWKKVWDQGAKEARGKGVDDVEDLVGLKVGQGEIDGEVGDEESEGDSEPEGPVKEAKRKTKQQKAKAKKLKEEHRIRAAIKASKRSSSDLQSLRSLKKQLLTMETEAAQVAEKRRESREKRKNERVGVYKLPKRDEEVQLGEDLAEGLRLLKVRGCTHVCTDGENTNPLCRSFPPTARGEPSQGPPARLPEARHRRAKEAQRCVQAALKDVDAGQKRVRVARIQAIFLICSAALPLQFAVFFFPLSSTIPCGRCAP